MFGLFNKTPYKVGDTAAEEKSGYIDPVVEVAKAPKIDTSPFYTIGTTTDGRTQISFGQDKDMKSALTMGDGAVAQMIRLLAVNIADTYTVTVTPVVQDNTSEETT